MWRRLLQGLLVAAATLAVLFHGAGVPSHRFWDDREPLFFSSAVVVALSTVFNTVGAWREEGDAKLQLELQDILKAAAVRITEVTSLEWTEPGLHIFKVRRRLPKFWKPLLVRTATWRVYSSPPLTGISWTKGKGIIGLCWEREKVAGANLTEDWGSRDTLMTPEEWNELHPALRYGLSHKEYVRAHKYGAVIASPILDEGSFRGCISLDASGDTYEELWKEEVRGILQDAALEAVKLMRGRRKVSK